MCLSVTAGNNNNHHYTRAQGVEVRRLIKAEAESMPFLPDNSIDAVVSTLVLCTVRDPAQVLAEIHRILRPDGKYCFIEHVRNHPHPPLGVNPPSSL